MRKIHKTTTLGSLFLAALLLLVIFLFRRHFNPDYRWFDVLLSVNFGYLLFKVFTAFFYRPVTESTAAHSITAIIPCYNESLESVEKAIQSLVNQTVLVEEIIFINDGSKELDCFQFLSSYTQPNIRIIPHRFAENQGKKAAILWGITHAQGDLLLMLDSDGELRPNTVEELRKPFEDPRVGTVCGRVMVRNFKASFLAKLQEIVYFNAFEVGRASQHLFHDVVVASGALSMHRREIFDEKALETFTKERFFGIKCIAGDDRLLTDISKQKGYRSVYQNTAICYTEVPEKLPKYFKQQVRWLKSAYLQSLYAIRHCWHKPMLLLYQLLEAYMWLANLIITFVVFFTKGLPVTPHVLMLWIIYSLLVALVNAIKYRQYGFHLYILSVIYSFIYGFLIFTMRIYALLTIWKSGWNTR